MAGRYTGSYLDRSNGWRAVAILADIGQSFTRRMHPRNDHITSGAKTYTELEGDIAMSDSSPYDAAQLLARLTVLERIVGMMVRDRLLETGKGPQDILAFGEVVKGFFKGRTPEGATDLELTDAADKFFSAIASDIGSQDSQ
jgi:hypothetical protein